MGGEQREADIDRKDKQKESKKYLKWQRGFVIV
jgi:hypothetical protein